MSTDWLAQLAAEHAPAAPSWWPPAPGWWIATGVSVAIAAWLVWHHFDRRRPRRQDSRSAALEELARIRNDAPPAATAPALQRLLRRYALTVFEREHIAPLAGESWLRFLSEYGAAGFADGGGRAFLSAAYGDVQAPTQREAWLEAAESFIRQAPRATRATDARA